MAPQATSFLEKTWTQFPGAPLRQVDLIELLPTWISGERLALATRLFRRARVSSRHMLATPTEIAKLGRGFAQKNDLYRGGIQREIAALCEKIRADFPHPARRAVDLLITVSCTGFQIPAMDAQLMQALELPRTARRLNLTQHGCAGGAAALGVAHEWLSTRPGARALIVCAELCSLTFQPEDHSNENLVAAAIFGDGAAAALLAGPEADPLHRPSAAPRLRLCATHREFFPRTEHFMGFDVNDAGLKIKLSPDVVPFATEGLPEVFARACAAWGIPGPHVFETGAIHPGGRRILEIIEEVAGVSRAVTDSSWACLDRCGNLSSVSVLASLDRVLARAELLHPGALGLVSAFGPGFCAELALLEAVA